MRPASAFTPAFKRIEVTAIVLACTLACFHVPDVLATGLWNLPVALGMLAGADLLSGITHWIFDRWGDESTPLFGPNLIRTFRDHHSDPLGITRHSFVESNGGPAIGAVPLLLAGFYGTAMVGAATTWLSVFLVGTNVIHGWAHGSAPPWVRRLQDVGVLLSAEHHAAHHEMPHDRCYCITTGWWNPLLDRLQVWGRLERLIGVATGARPHRY